MSGSHANRFGVIGCAVASMLCVSAGPKPLSVLPTDAPEPKTGPWRAWLDSPGGEIPFGLELAKEGDTWRAWLLNDPERIEVPQVLFTSGVLVLNIDHYDARLVAQPSENGTRLDGQWTRRTAGDRWMNMPFHATAGNARRFRAPPKHARERRSVDGRWAVTFSESSDPAVAVFKQGSDGTVTGTFLTTTGDYRYLAGQVDGRRLRLSCFDGAHAFLFDATVGRDGVLNGDFWSRDTWHETWTARLNPLATLPDPFMLTSAVGDGKKIAALTFPDPDGDMRWLGEPALTGNVRLIEIFGTWCPNCYDAATYLMELDAKYRERGLKIVGLAFELTGDAKRDVAQVRTYVKRREIKYPVLIAGVSDKKEASAVVPFLDRIRAYPTFVFLDRANKVRAVYTGFSGPATGRAYEKLRADFEKLIDRLLGE